MKLCIKCKNQNSDELKYCVFCGWKFPTDVDNEKRFCGNCGLALDSFTAYCPACGAEQHNVQQASAFQELEQELEWLEKQKGETRFWYYRVSKIDRQIAKTIEGFPLPNSREAILEMMIMAVSKIDPDDYGTPLQTDRSPGERATRTLIDNAWIKKYEQARMKAALVKLSGSDTELIHEQFIKKQRKINRNKFLYFLFTIIPLILLLTSPYWVLAFLKWSFSVRI